MEEILDRQMWMILLLVWVRYQIQTFDGGFFFFFFFNGNIDSLTISYYNHTKIE